MKTKRTRQFGLLFVVLCGLLVSSVSADVVWEKSYDANTDPISWGWTQHRYNGNGAIMGSGICTIDAMYKDANYLYYDFNGGNTSEFDGTSGTTTIEFRMKLDAASGPHDFFVADGSKKYDLTFSNTSVGGPDPAVMMDTTDDFHIYRIVIQNSSADLYIDNNPTGYYHPGHSSSVNDVQWGDIRTDYKSKAYWDYIRWTNSEATPPIPEPATIAMMMIGAAGLICRKR